MAIHLTFDTASELREYLNGDDYYDLAKLHQTFSTELETLKARLAVLEWSEGRNNTILPPPPDIPSLPDIPTIPVSDHEAVRNEIENWSEPQEDEYNSNTFDISDDIPF